LQNKPHTHTKTTHNAGGQERGASVAKGVSLSIDLNVLVA